MTAPEYEMLKFKQGYSCAICGKQVKLHVDHDHETGEVRGLLCNNCNVGLGFFDDNPMLLIAAIRYLKSSLP